MKNAIILHGGPSKDEYYNPETPSESNDNWLPWIQAQLLKQDIAAATPEVPRAFDRHWPTWMKEVERFDIGPETILVGHSTGARFFVKYLSIHPDVNVDKVVLVAPWLDPDREHTKNFFDDFEIDPDLVSRTNGITIFNSDNDQASVQKTVSILRNTVKDIMYREFHNYGHFLSKDMGTLQFPELLEEIIAEK
jgi:predicted alpha/beta hydrolase family esterase